jgi:hypothetical protein
MWTTVVVLALALNLEPNRLGIIGLLFLRPHPIRQLLAFLCTSFVVSSTGGLVVLFLAHRGSVLKGDFSSAVIQIGMGTLALVMAAVLFSNIPMPGNKRSTAIPLTPSPAGSPDDPPPVPRSGLALVDTITKRAGRLARGSSLWFPTALGLGISLPSVDYVALLLLIAASGETPKVQVAALFTFLTVANAILLIPIISYAIARQRTLRILESLRSWVLARTRRDYAVLLVIVGALMIAVGLSHL